MTRRSFLQVLGLAVAAAFVPTKLLEQIQPEPSPIFVVFDTAAPDGEYTAFTDVSWDNCANSNPLADLRAMRDLHRSSSSVFSGQFVTYVTQAQFEMLQHLSSEEKSYLRRFVTSWRVFR